MALEYDRCSIDKTVIADNFVNFIIKFVGWC